MRIQERITGAAMFEEYQIVAEVSPVSGVMGSRRKLGLLSEEAVRLVASPAISQDACTRSLKV